MVQGVAIVSGGLDSVTLLHHLVAAGDPPDVLSFDYGQRHSKELDCAALACRRLGLRWDLVSMPELRHMLAPSRSALVSDHPVPHGHYAAATMAQTVVPNRNMIMLSVAAGVAVARGGCYVATAVHAGDHAIYPDCRPEFIDAMQAAVVVATGLPRFHVRAPFLHWAKAAIAARAGELGVPIDTTWSCYEGGPVHCGRCGTCVERQEAMAQAGVADPTKYADPDYWRTQVEA